MVLMNLRLAPPDLSYIMNHSESKIVVVDETLLPLVEAIAPQCPAVRGYVIITDKDLKSVQTKLDPVWSYEDLIQESGEEIDWPNLDERSACAACYTTGTTGRPKGVYYSHRSNYLHALAFISQVRGVQSGCYLQLAPMFHVMGWGGPYITTLAGSKIVLPGMYSLETLGGLADIMLQEIVTFSAGAPALFMPLLEYIRKMDPKPDFTGTQLICGATEPPLSMMKALEELTGAEIIHAYGATETSPLAAVNYMKPWMEGVLSEEEKWDLRKKQGYAATGLDLKVMDPAGEEVPHDGQSVGEFCIRGPWIAGSYYKSQEESAQFTKDGYWRSGDAGTIDDEGYLKITDRLKDIIKSGGEWISSVDMENTIVAIPGVLEGSVIGISHPKWDERPLALVVLNEEFKEKVDKAHVMAYLSKTFAQWQLPDEVLFVDEIAKTSVGKANKRALREMYGKLYEG